MNDDRLMLYFDRCYFISSDSHRHMRSSFSDCLIDHVCMVTRNRRHVFSAQRDDGNGNHSNKLSNGRWSGARNVLRLLVVCVLERIELEQFSDNLCILDR